MTVRVWVNGHLRGDEASLSALDHGVTVGDGAFETLKIVDGRPFAMTRHARRLDRSLGGLGLPAADHALIAVGAAVLGAGEPIPFGRLRYTVTAGVGPLGSDRPATDSSGLTYVVTAGEQAPPPESARSSSCRGPATSGRRRPGSRPPRMRTTSSPSRGPRRAAHPRRSSATPAVSCAGDRLQRVRRRRRRRRHATGRLRCAGGHHPRAHHRVVSRGRPGGRGTAPPARRAADRGRVFICSTRDVFALHAVDDRELTPGPVTARAAKVFAARAAEDLDP